MSYEIIYKVGSFKTSKGYLPFVIMGSNNCFEITGRGQRRERNVYFLHSILNKEHRKTIFYNDLAEVKSNFIINDFEEEIKNGSIQGNFKTRQGIIRALSSNVIEEMKPYFNLRHLYYCSEEIDQKFKAYCSKLDIYSLDLDYYVNFYNDFLNSISLEEKQKVLDYLHKTEISINNILDILNISNNGYNVCNHLQRNSIKKPKISIYERIKKAEEKEPIYKTSKDYLIRPNYFDITEEQKQFYLQEENRFNSFIEKILNKIVYVPCNYGDLVGSFKKKRNGAFALFKYKSKRKYYDMSINPRQINKIYLI